MRNTISIIALILVIAGALNWLLVGIFSFNLVDWAFGPMTVLSRIIYILIGLAGVVSIAYLVDRQFRLYSRTKASATPAAY